MKRLFFTFSILAAVALAGNYIDFFYANAGNDVVYLHWGTCSEKNLQRFEIMRSSGEGEEFIEIASIQPKGNPSEYQYEDREIFGIESSYRTCYYQIKLVDKSGAAVEFSKVVEVRPQISDFKKTWGSIKALLR